MNETQKALHSMVPGEIVTRRVVMERTGLRSMNAGVALARLAKYGQVTRVRHGFYKLARCAPPLSQGMQQAGKGAR